MGEVPPELFFQTWLKAGIPPLITSFNPDRPLPLATKTQVEPSAGLVHTAGWVNTAPPCGTAKVPISPPVCPVPPCPLRLSRFNRRRIPSLPPWTARCFTVLAD